MIALIMRSPNLSELTFGRLVVIERLRSSGRGVIWSCLCECGNLTKVTTHDLRAGNTKSCGCLRRETAAWTGTNINPKHNMANSPEWHAYRSAKYRCNIPTNQAYRNYGGRGIKFMFTSFQEFYAEVGPKPEGMFLDRIDNNGHYEVGNVRWATPLESAKNRRQPIYI